VTTTGVKATRCESDDMQQLIIAHDLGTSGDKVSLHAADGRLLAAHTEHYPTDYGPGGKAEQRPADWWDAFCSATRALLAQAAVDVDEVACVVLSGQMMGAVLVDAEDQPLRPALIWADTRATAETARLIEAVGFDHGYQLLGHRLDPTYSLPKLMWLRDHDPAAWADTDAVLQPKDYITLRLTGRRVTDPSDASGTLAFDQGQGMWSARMLEVAGIDIALLPEIVPSASVAGGVSAEVAGSTGLQSGTPVVVGGGDGATSALGVGLVASGSSACATLGSSAWLSVVTDTPARDPQARTVTFNHVVPGHFLPLGPMQAAGTSLEWLAETLGVGHEGIAGLVASASSAPAATEGLFFLPYLVGERAPIWDVNARGTFIGLSRHHGPANLARAVLEGVAFNLYGTFRALSDGVRPIERVDAVGGGARSDTWLQIMADAWGVPVRRRTIVDEANSLGAAVVGGMAVGLIDDWDAARSLSEVEAVFEPDDARHVRMLDGYRRFTDAYDRLASWFEPTSD
jgi:xylulokinase